MPPCCRGAVGLWILFTERTAPLPWHHYASDEEAVAQAACRPGVVALVCLPGASWWCLRSLATQLSPRTGRAHAMTSNGHGWRMCQLTLQTWRCIWRHRHRWRQRACWWQRRGLGGRIVSPKVAVDTAGGAHARERAHGWCRVPPSASAKVQTHTCVVFLAVRTLQRKSAWLAAAVVVVVLPADYSIVVDLQSR
jgi:hypothetical protein